MSWIIQVGQCNPLNGEEVGGRRVSEGGVSTEEWSERCNIMVWKMEEGGQEPRNAPSGQMLRYCHSHLIDGNAAPKG